MVALYHISNKLDVCTNTATQAQLMNDISNKLDVCTNTANQAQLMNDEVYWILYNGTCYYFSEEKEDWESSEKQCAMMGAQLAVLSENHIHENTKRFSKFPDDYWCGLHRVNTVWHWLNEPLKENVTISDYPDMNCGSIVLKGNGYNANDCNTKKLFVCTKSAKERIYIKE
ncbi:CD209 antigen-like protein E [Bombina bombina]|uniref:CD209 antigen-like protein E n=1 Tax=Bombina bombina TaxID=8345 RepID=UPI00235A76F0|nr:CD209 antigen-like protein E [Bombina bombina]